MRLRRFKGTILVGVLVIAPFIVDGWLGAPAPGADVEQGDEGTHVLGLEDAPRSETTSGSGRSSLRVTHGTESGGSRMGGDSRMGGNSLHGLDTGGADATGSGQGDLEKGSIF